MSERARRGGAGQEGRRRPRGACRRGLVPPAPALPALLSAAAPLLLLLALGARAQAPDYAMSDPGWDVHFLHAGDPTANATYAAIMGSGVCAIDYDNDGWDDLFFVNERYADPGLQANFTPHPQLYRNLQGQGFAKVTGTVFDNVSVWGMGCAVGDYLGNGRQDIALNTWGGPLLFRNDGNGTFTNVTDSAGIARTHCRDAGGGNQTCFGSSIAWIDYDEDGRLDLYALNYVAWDGVGPSAPNAYPGQCNLLYHNNGDGTFTEVAAQVGADDCGRNHLALAVGDDDGDGHQDIFIACDESSATLLRNNGNGTFTDVTVAENLTDFRGGMGAAWGDVNGDGKLDLAVSHFESERFGLFVQQPNGTFADEALARGLNGTLDRTGWGTELRDLTDDGNLDAVFVDGHVNVSYGGAYGYGQENLVYRNDGAGHFTNVTGQTWYPAPVANVSRGLLLNDLDQDGYLDAVVVDNPNQSAEVWHGVRGPNNWLELKLRGNATINPSALGAWAEADVGGKALKREVLGASSYLSDPGRTLAFGLGDATQVDTLTVHWPGGASQTFANVTANQVLALAPGGTLDVVRARPLADAPRSLTVGRGGSVTLHGSVVAAGTGNVTEQWTVGGQTYAGSDANVTFSDLGDVEARFRVTDDSGHWDEAVTRLHVVDAPPTVVLSVPATADRVHPATLDASASTDADGTVANFTWTVEGDTLYGATVQHTFRALGNVPVQVHEVDNNGSASDGAATVEVVNLPPTAQPGPDLVGNPRSTFRLDGSASRDPDGSVVAWAWDLGDGSSAAGAQVNKSYAAPGNYTVTLTVTDNDGATASGTLNVTVDDQDAPPVAVPGPGRTGDRVHALTFDGSGSYDPDGSVVAWHWDFGDGNASDGATVNHTYASLGNFTATLTVTDDGGLGGNASVRVAVVNLPPVLSDVSVPARWQGLGAIAFSAEASDPDGPAPSLRWDFGDGATATGPRASHAYAAYGHYAVTVTATDADGAAVSSGASVWVYALPVPVLAGPGSTDRLTTNSFEGNSSFDPDGQVVAWSWDFGDGASAHGAEAAHRYGRLGTFPVTLTVTDDDGFTNATTALVTVRNLPPVARVHAYGLANVNESLPYDGTGSSDPDGTVVAWSWDFGDGATATGPSPGHTYSAPGNYTVTLVVTDNDGGIGRTSQAVQVVDWLRVAVVLDAPAYSALAPPTGHVEASFANGLPVPGAAVAMRFAYRVDPQSPLASPLPTAPLPAPSPLPWEPFAEETRNTTDDGGRSDFAGPSVVAGLPFLQVPTEGPVSEARADARVTWEGNVGTGGAAYATYLVAPGLA